MPTDTTPPSAPTGLTASAGNHTVSLDWNNNSESDTNGYNIYRSTTSGSGYVKINGSPVSSSNYIDNTVTNETTYYYVVTAVDTVGNESDYSNEASAMPRIYVEILGSWVSGTSHAKENGTNRALIFLVHAEYNNSGVSLNSVTYGGQTMAKIIDRFFAGPQNGVYVAAFMLNDAGIVDANSSGTFSPSWTGSPTGIAYSSVFLREVDQTSPVSASSSGAGGTATITTAALSTNNGDMVIEAAACSTTGTFTLNNNFSLVTEYTMTGSDGVDGYKRATGVSEIPSVTHSISTARKVILGFVVNARDAVVYSNCGEVLAAGYRLAADINGTGDCYVDYEDLDTFVEYWLSTDCSGPDNCHGADFVPADGVVDLFDFSDFARQWMMCNDPEDPECTPNW
jgi:hypothetical protein